MEIFKKASPFCSGFANTVRTEDPNVVRPRLSQHSLDTPEPRPLDDAVGRLPQLAASHGFSVVALDGDVGEVETPLFPPAGGEPDFLVLRLASEEATFAVVPVQLITHVDSQERRISLDASCSAVAEMRGDIALEY